MTGVKPALLTINVPLLLIIYYLVILNSDYTYFSVPYLLPLNFCETRHTYEAFRVKPNLLTNSLILRLTINSKIGVNGLDLEDQVQQSSQK